MRRTLLFVLGSCVMAGLVFGCDTRTAPGGRDSGGPVITVDSGVTGTRDSGIALMRDAGGPIDPSCGTAAARWIYAVDSNDAFLRFDPETNALSPIGTLSCPTSSSPFSMAVDRSANAWVLYQDGRIYRVSTADVSCTATSFTPGQSGFDVFGMGFVSDAAGSTVESLFVAGGSELDISFGTAQLGRVDTTSLALTPLGDLPGWPELTGTGAAELYGFFPDTSPPSVRQIDKLSGATTRSFPMSALGTGGTGDRAWAFAFWGGRFFVFYKGPSDDTTNVWRLDPADGSVVEVVHETGYRIVGAGVSTCAPVILI